MVHSVAIWNDVLEDGTVKIFLKRGRLTVHSSAIWNDNLEVSTAEKIRNKQVAYWWILLQFETM